MRSYLNILRSSAGSSAYSAAVVAGLLVVFPGISLERGEGALEKGVVDDVALAVFSANDPVAALDVAEAEVGGDGLIFLALRGVDEQWPACTKSTHDSSAGRVKPAFLIRAPRA